MTVYFLDTSALVKRYHAERGSQVIDAICAEHERHIIISDLSILELGSALMKKVREREITPEKYRRALGFFYQNIVSEAIHVESLEGVDKSTAAVLLEKHGFRANLRTLDSLQLAVMKRVAENPLDRVLCADRAFYALIQQEGLSVWNPEEDHSLQI